MLAGSHLNVGTLLHVDGSPKCWKNMWDIFAEPYVRRTMRARLASHAHAHTRLHVTKAGRDA